MERPNKAEAALTRLLLVDDDPDDFVLTKEVVQAISRGRYSIDWIYDYESAHEAICKSEHDVYLIDYRIGARNGLDLMRECREKACLGPMILLTGQTDFEIDISAMEAGAADFLEKSRLDPVSLERSLRYAISKDRVEKALERKVAERTAKLEAANEALKEASRRKDEFLATLAHELRNPLAPIRNAIEIMRLAPDKPQSVEGARSLLERQVATMVRLIDDLMDVSRITRGKILLYPEKVDLRNSIEDALEIVRPQVDKAGLTLDVDWDEGQFYVKGDRVRLSQIFTNIMANSIKYTERGGRILVKFTHDQTYHIVSIEDTGVGIPSEALPHIFDLFTQIDRSLNRAKGGLGIGLALVRQLVELHGGTVEAHSDGIDCGARFSVRIPNYLNKDSR
jgi:signal transduction histidine kinase